MADTGRPKRSFGQSFSAFDRADRLLDWNDDFAEEFAAAKDLIAVGAPLGALLVRAFAHDPVASADRAEQAPNCRADGRADAAALRGARSRAFNYRDGAGRILLVNEERTLSGGMIRTARDATAERNSSATFAESGDEWCLDGDPSAEAIGSGEITADGGFIFGPAGEDLRALWGLGSDFDLTDWSAISSRRILGQGEVEAQLTSRLQAMTTLEPFRHETRIRDGSNRLRWIRSVTTLTRRPDGGTLFRSRLRDVTRERLAEDQLALLRSAVSHASDIVQIVHIDAQGLSTITYANPAFERTTGWAVDDVMGRPIGEMTGWDDYWEKIEALVD
jgi:PAS domain-containing protein